MSLSRSNVIYFRHNDTKHLEAILDDIREKDLLQPFTKPPRRFIVVEGLYQNRGDICPLEEIVALKKKFRYRLILEDSMAVGVLGENGKGSIDHWKCNVRRFECFCTYENIKLLFFSRKMLT